MPSGVAIESTQTQQYSHARSLVIGIGLGFGRVLLDRVILILMRGLYEMLFLIGTPAIDLVFLDDNDSFSYFLLLSFSWTRLDIGG